MGLSKWLNRSRNCLQYRRQMLEIWLHLLGQEDPLEEYGIALQYYCLENPWTEELDGLQSIGCKESDMTQVTEHNYFLNSFVYGRHLVLHWILYKLSWISVDCCLLRKSQATACEQWSCCGIYGVLSETFVCLDSYCSNRETQDRVKDEIQVNFFFFLENLIRSV